MKSITYIISNIDKAIAFEWIIQEINTQKYKLSFILLNNKPSHLENFIKEAGLEVHRIKLRSKRDYPKAILAAQRKLKAWKAETIHCHMRDANFVGMIAAKLAGINKRIYTRHFSTYNHMYFPKAVKIDKLINRMATDIVAISEVVKNILIEQEGVPKEKVSLIPHGFDLEKFSNVNHKSVENLKRKYNPNGNYPVIGVIARYIDWKGHKYIIDAFQKLLQDYPDALFIFANSHGPQKKIIKELLQNKIPNNYVEIQFEHDLFSLYKLFNIYVHTPIDPQIEAFGQTYVEALASGVSSIFTLSGIAREFIQDEYNALVVPFQSSDKIKDGIALLLNDKDKVANLIENGVTSTRQFGLRHFIDKIEKLYA